jgi:hypothetical protein
MTKTILGQDMKEDFSMKKCCNVCGFPVKMEREPVILKNSVVSLIEYDTNTCLSCSHQADGSTITVVHNRLQGLCNRFIKEREDLIRFLHHYEFMEDGARKGVCVELPRFMKPNHKSTGSTDDDMLEPYSWDVVYNEVINGTELSRVMVRDIDWKNLENNDN